MAWTEVQGKFAYTSTSSGGAPTSISITLNSAPVAGHLVCVGMEVDFALTITLTNLLIKDSNNNPYTITPTSPLVNATVAPKIYIFLGYLVAPANASATINASWTLVNNSAGGEATIFVEEFVLPTGTAYPLLDKDSAGTGTTGTTINTPSITPANSGELLFAYSIAYSVITAPTAGGSLGGWTGSAAGIEPNSGSMAEYILNSGTSSTAVDFTQTTSDGWSCMAMGFYSSSPNYIIDDYGMTISFGR